jgi:hypothetical protein
MIPSAYDRFEADAVTFATISINATQNSSAMPRRSGMTTPKRMMALPTINK